MNKDFLVTIKEGKNAFPYVVRTSSAGGAASKALHFFYNNVGVGRDLAPNSAINVNVERVAPCVAKQMTTEGIRKIQ